MHRFRSPQSFEYDEEFSICFNQKISKNISLIGNKYLKRHAMVVQHTKTHKYTHLPPWLTVPALPPTGTSPSPVAQIASG